MLIPEKPGRNVIPGTEVVKEPYTYIKAYAASVVVLKDEKINGVTTNASGPILKILDKNNNELPVSEDNEIQLNNEQVYTFVLSNNNGKSFIQDEELEDQFY